MTKRSGSISIPGESVAQSGFTLIELLIVLAIVAVLLVVASPNYDSIISGSKVDETRLGLATSLALIGVRGPDLRSCRA